MKKKENTLFKKIIFLLVYFMVLVHSSITVVFVGGISYVQREKENSKIKIATGDKLETGDIIITGSRSFVILRSDDNSIFKVLSNTGLKINYYFNTLQERKGKFTLLEGKVLAFISKLFKKSEIKMINEIGVVSVRGTSFLLESNNDTMKVHLIQGEIAIFEDEKSLDPIRIINEKKSIEKNRGSSELKITPLKENILKEANEEIHIMLEMLYDYYMEKEIAINKKLSNDIINEQVTEND